jgi:hypothetical protein
VIDLSVQFWSMTNCRRLLFLCATFAIACGGSRSVGKGEDPKASPAEHDAGPEQPVVAKAIHVALEIYPPKEYEDPPKSRIVVVTTNETGSTERSRVGSFAGTCEDVSTAHRRDPMTPLLSADCTKALVRLVKKGDKLVILRAWVAEDVDAFSFDPIGEVELPFGVPVTTD